MTRENFFIGKTKRETNKGDILHQTFKQNLIDSYSQENNLQSAAFYCQLQGIDIDVMLASLISMKVSMKALSDEEKEENKQIFGWKTIEGPSVEEQLFTPSPCGAQAGAICLLMAGDEMKTI